MDRRRQPTRYERFRSFDADRRPRFGKGGAVQRKRFVPNMRCAILIDDLERLALFIFEPKDVDLEDVRVFLELLGQARCYEHGIVVHRFPLRGDARGHP